MTSKPRVPLSAAQVGCMPEVYLRLRSMLNDGERKIDPPLEVGQLWESLADDGTLGYMTLLEKVDNLWKVHHSKIGVMKLRLGDWFGPPEFRLVSDDGANQEG